MSFDAYLSRCEDAAMREPDGCCPLCGLDADVAEYRVRGWCDVCQAQKLGRIAGRWLSERDQRKVRRRGLLSRRAARYDRIHWPYPQQNYRAAVAARRKITAHKGTTEER